MTIIDGIEVVEKETPPNISLIKPSSKIILNPRLTSDWRVRTVIRLKLEAAAEALPKGISLMLYEAFRSRSRQRALWQPVFEQIKGENPGWTEDQVFWHTSNWVSPPDGFGSGHQAGAAIDITLATSAGDELDMGAAIQTFGPITMTDASVSGAVQERRDLLVETLTTQGLVNYPAEWWHFSYGDRLWAEVTGRTKAFYAPID